PPRTPSAAVRLPLYPPAPSRRSARAAFGIALCFPGFGRRTTITLFSQPFRSPPGPPGRRTVTNLPGRRARAARNECHELRPRHDAADLPGPPGRAVHPVPDRDVGALQLLRHARPADAVHGELLPLGAGPGLDHLQVVLQPRLPDAAVGRLP